MALEFNVGDLTRTVLNAGTVQPERHVEIAFQHKLTPQQRAQSHGDALTPTKFLDTRIFVLEDNRANAVILLKYLSMLGFPKPVAVTTLADVKPHLDDIFKGTYGAIFLDIMLPDGDSIALLRQLKKSAVRNVFAYTALANPQETADLEAEGYDHIFTKPLGLDVLRHTLTAMLSGGQT